MNTECPIHPLALLDEPRQPQLPFRQAAKSFPEEVIDRIPVKPRKRIAIVENKGGKDLYEDSFVVSHLMHVDNKDIQLKVDQRDEIYIESGGNAVAMPPRKT